MTLRGKVPEAKDKRLKMMLFGPAGIGKTTCAIQFPNAYIFDLERGSDFYHETIKNKGSVVFQTTNPDDVKEELKKLITEKHEFKTIILDPITVLYSATQEKWNRVFTKYAETEKQTELGDFGFRFWAKVKQDYKAIIRLLLSWDGNVILTSHQKDIYGEGMKKVGLGSDSMKGDEYAFDYIFQLTKDAKDKRIAITKKERAEVGKNKFPQEFEWSYANFLIYYGKDALERESTPVPLASAEQVGEIKRLLSIVKVDEQWESDCLTKADVDSWEELTKEKIEKAITFLQNKKEGK